MKIRIRISLDIADGLIAPDTTPAQLKARFGPAIGRAVAAGLPDDIKVDTATVTRINVATPAPAEGETAEE